MVDEKKSPQDEEYQYPEEEYTASDKSVGEDVFKDDDADESAARARRHNPLAATLDTISTMLKSKNKRVILIVVIIVVVIGIAKLVSLFRDESQSQLVQSTPTQTVKTPAPQPVVVVQPPAPVVSQPNNNDLDATQNEALQNQNSEMHSQVETMQGQLNKIEDAVAQSTDSTGQLQASVNALTQQVQVLTKQLQEMMARQQKAPKQKEAVFYLRAVVPDRAWVMTPSGETVSVSVGDSLDSYGRILSIDPVYGVIRTSSGRKITYGANDY